MKTTFTLATLFIFVLVGGYELHAYTQRAPVSAYSVPTTSVVATSSAPLNTVTIVSTTTVTTATPSGYTSAQVATHNTAANCWTSINGNIYDLTKWIGTHPGGEAAIIQLCGTDGSSAFNGQHGNDGRANRMLASFIIGPLGT